jgi:hypothetical protein
MNGADLDKLAGDGLPNIDTALFAAPAAERLACVGRSTHAPRLLLLYGSLRERSYSKLLTLEAARLLIAMGAEVRIFDPTGLPLPDGAPDTHPKVQELRDLAAWAEGMDPAVRGRRAADPGQDAGGDGGVGWIAVLQCRQPDAHPGALDAHDHHP